MEKILATEEPMTVRPKSTREKGGIPQSVVDFRKEYRTGISERYSGTLHFCYTSFSCLITIGIFIALLENVKPLEWLTIPITFLYANLVEYIGHKGPMHQPTKYLMVVFKRHAGEHHRYFTHEAMTYENSRDFKMVLFPPEMLLFFFLFFAVPVGLLLRFFVSHNTAHLFVITSTAYFLNYEWLHFIYHLPEGSWVSKIPFVGRLRKHHTAHHNQTLMTRYNFNITYPLFDWIFKTIAKDERD